MWDVDMQGIGGIAVAFAVLAMAQPVVAATSLCIEDGSTGFTWKDGAWKSQKWNESKYVIRKASETEGIASGCVADINAKGGSLIPVEKYGYTTSEGCYVLTPFGSEELLSDACTEYWDGDEIEVVSCDDAIIYKYGFRPAGEFYIYTTGSITAGKPGEIPADKQRQPAFISVGKCSVIAP